MTLRSAGRWALDHSLPTVLAANALALAVYFVGPALLGTAPAHEYLLPNLALAWAPFIAALGVEAYAGMRRRRSMWAGGVVWLLFLPNAPYLLTDLHHLGEGPATPWLNLARFVAFGWAGLVLGLTSLRIVQRTVDARSGRWMGWLLVCVSAVACGVGIAIGRFGRLNSWQVVTNPRLVASEALRLSASPQAIGVAGFFCFFILVMYMATTTYRIPRRS